MKKLLALSLICGITFGSGLSVEAAGLKDVFNAKYYADQYQDLYDAFGYNETLLYRHFLQYGLKEGRVMNPVIDIVKYRDSYEDLDNAFGNNWDAYVQHYIEYGIKEKRDNGTDFDPIAYVESYADIEAAFGDNFEAIIDHYQEYGMNEERKEASKVYQEEKKQIEAAKKQETTKQPEIEVTPDNKPEIPPVIEDEDDTPEQQERVEVEYDSLGYKHEYRYDANDKLLSVTDYNEAGEFISIQVYEYNEEGKPSCIIDYNPLKEVNCIWKYEYDDKGNCSSYIKYQPDGTVIWTMEYEYDENNEKIKEIWTNFPNKGQISETTYKDGKPLKNVSYNMTDRSILSWRDYGYDEDGNMIKYIDYDQDGYIYSGYEYDSAGNIVIEYGSDEPGTYYAIYYEMKNGKNLPDIMKKYINEGNVLFSIMEYDDNGNEVVLTIFNNDGSVREIYKYEYDESGKKSGCNKYNSDGKLTQNESYVYINGYPQYQKVTRYDLDGECIGWSEYEYNDKGLTTKYTSYDAQGNISYWNSDEYDDNGVRIKQTYFYAYNNTTTIKVFDENGNVVSEEVYDGEGNIIS